MYGARIQGRGAAEELRVLGFVVIGPPQTLVFLEKALQSSLNYRLIYRGKKVILGAAT